MAVATARLSDWELATDPGCPLRDLEQRSFVCGGVLSWRHCGCTGWTARLVGFGPCLPSATVRAVTRLMWLVLAGLGLSEVVYAGLLVPGAPTASVFWLSFVFALACGVPVRY